MTASRSRLVAICCALALALGSCGTLCRAGKDLAVGLASPGTMLWCGVVDGVGDGYAAAQDSGGGAAVQVLVTPLAFLWNALEHGAYGVVHVVDLSLCPAYAVIAHLTPSGQDVMPLDIYQDTWFDRQAVRSRRGGDDAAGPGEAP